MLYIHNMNPTYGAPLEYVAAQLKSALADAVLSYVCSQYDENTQTERSALNASTMQLLKSPYLIMPQ